MPFFSQIPDRQALSPAFLSAQTRFSPKPHCWYCLSCTHFHCSVSDWRSRKTAFRLPASSLLAAVCNNHSTPFLSAHTKSDFARPALFGKTFPAPCQKSLCGQSPDGGSPPPPIPLWVSISSGCRPPLPVMICARPYFPHNFYWSISPALSLAASISAPVKVPSVSGSSSDF